MIILNPIKTLELLNIVNKTDILKMYDASVKTLNNEFTKNPVTIIEYLMHNHVSLADFNNSTNVMLDFYKEEENYDQCGIINTISDYVNKFMSDTTKSLT